MLQHFLDEDFWYHTTIFQAWPEQEMLSIHEEKCDGKQPEDPGPGGDTQQIQVICVAQSQQLRA